MLFNSIAFLAFFPLVTVLYFTVPLRARMPVLLLASCAFYMAFVPAYVLILAYLIGVDYVAGILIERSTGRRRRSLLIVSLVANVGTLVIFKYYGFLADNVNTLAALLNPHWGLPPLRMLLPIGLSFHTFQAMSYTIEVYKGRQPAERNLLAYALYVMFYPQLVAGPIERPQHLLPQLAAPHPFDYGRLVNGLRRMAFGMFKKVVVADMLAAQVDVIYDAPRHFTGLSLITATVFFAFQIYYDFSGYTDIALGSAEVMGIRLRENFRLPYLASSVAEFWRRWHISLSTWFRDYVYIPLGGNRRGPVGQAIAVMTVFLVSGLWHGANWTFVLWGAIHGVYLLVGRGTAEVRARFRAAAARVLGSSTVAAGSVLMTFILVSLAWVFFRARTIGDAWYVLSHLHAGFGAQLRGGLHQGVPGMGKGALLCALLVVMTTIAEYMSVERYGAREHITIGRAPAALRYAVYYAVIYAAILMAGASGAHQFIYFQF